MSYTKEFAAREAKNHFGELLDSAQRNPVYITKNGRQVAVLLSREDYERFEAFEDAVWGARAMEAQKGEFLSAKESAALLKRMRDA